jgi:hypothetical protein
MSGARRDHDFKRSPEKDGTRERRKDRMRRTLSDANDFMAGFARLWRFRKEVAPRAFQFRTVQERKV